MPRSKILRVPFPTKGLDEHTSFEGQTPETTPDCTNVVAFDPRTGRNRGGQRSGIDKYHPDQSDDGGSIQHLSHFVGPEIDQLTGDGTVAVPAGSDITFRSNDDGTESASVAFTETFQLSEWGQDNRLYVAIADNAGGSGDLYIRKYKKDGTLVYSNNPISLTASGRQVLGMAIDGNFIFLWTDNTSGESGQAIYRIRTEDGTLVDSGAWLSETTDFVGGLVPSNNGLSITSGMMMLVVDRTGPERLDADFFSLDSGTLLVSTSLRSYDTGTTREVKDVATNGYNLFYAITKTVESATDTWTITRLEVNSVGAGWVASKTQRTQTAGSIESVAYPFGQASFVYVVGEDLFGVATKSFARLDSTSLSTTFDSTAVSIDKWEVIRVTQEDHFIISKDASGTNLAKINNSGSTTTPGWTASLTTSVGIPSASAARDFLTVNCLGVRKIRGIQIADGTLSTFDSDGKTIAGNGDGIFTLRKTIFGTQLGVNIFFADTHPLNDPYYFSSASIAALPWIPTAGSLPITVDTNDMARLIATWRGRIVMSGLRTDPQNWFMSKVDDAFDWDYSPATVTETDAIAGNNSFAGLVGDIVNSLIPYNDDLLLFGGDHSIWQMTGDPGAGGRIDRISDSVGMAWGRAWARNPAGSILFMSSRGGIYIMDPGRIPEKISSRSIDERLSKVDMEANSISLAWDDRQIGLAVFITPFDRTQATTHFFWDARNNAWFPFKFKNKDHNPKVVHTFDGDAPGDRVTLIGSWDGYVRYLNVDAKEDDGTEIESNVVLGPIGAVNPAAKIMIKDVQATLGDNTSEVSYKVKCSDSAEQAFNDIPTRNSGLWYAGRNQSERERIACHRAYVEIANSSRDETWSFEDMNLEYHELGPRHSRQITR